MDFRAPSRKRTLSDLPPARHPPSIPFTPRCSFSPIPDKSYLPQSIGTKAAKDDTFLRCRSVWYLDALWTATHPQNTMSFVSGQKNHPISLDKIVGDAEKCGLEQ